MITQLAVFKMFEILIEDAEARLKELGIGSCQQLPPHTEVITVPITAFTLVAVKRLLEIESVFHFRTVDGVKIDFVREKLPAGRTGGWGNE